MVFEESRLCSRARVEGVERRLFGGLSEKGDLFVYSVGGADFARGSGHEGVVSRLGTRACSGVVLSRNEGARTVSRPPHVTDDTFREGLCLRLMSSMPLRLFEPCGPSRHQIG